MKEVLNFVFSNNSYGIVEIKFLKQEDSSDICCMQVRIHNKASADLFHQSSMGDLKINQIHGTVKLDWHISRISDDIIQFTGDVKQIVAFFIERELFDQQIALQLKDINYQQVIPFSSSTSFGLSEQKVSPPTFFIPPEVGPKSSRDVKSKLEPVYQHLLQVVLDRKEAGLCIIQLIKFLDISVEDLMSLQPKTEITTKTS